MSMTVEEAKAIIERKSSIPMENETFEYVSEAYDMAIQALEEVQEYRRIGLGKPAEFEQDLLLYKADRVLVNEYSAIGTVEELQKMKDDYAEAIIDWRQYKKIGTIERFRELTEKAEPKKPIYGEFDENELEEIIPYKATCPTCGFEFEFGTWNDEENHHCECGQRMNWEREEQR